MTRRYAPPYPSVDGGTPSATSGAYDGGAPDEVFSEYLDGGEPNDVPFLRNTLVKCRHICGGGVNRAGAGAVADDKGAGLLGNYGFNAFSLMA